MRTQMSCRWLMSRGPQALTADEAAFAASWRFSNCTIRASNQRDKKIVKKGAVKIRVRIFLELSLLATMALDSASLARAALISSSTVRRTAWEASRQISS